METSYQDPYAFYEGVVHDKVIDLEYFPSSEWTIDTFTKIFIEKNSIVCVIILE
jgi:hypothetical protein